MSSWSTIRTIEYWKWSSPVIAVAAVLVIEMMRKSGNQMPVPFLSLYMIVVFSCAYTGRLPGTLSGIIAAAYVVYASIVNFGPPTLTGGQFQASLGCILYVLTGWIIGGIRDRYDHFRVQSQLHGAHLEELVQQRTAELGQLIAAIEKIDECVIIYDDDNRILYCNEAYKKLNQELGDLIKPGTTRTELLEAAVKDIILPTNVDSRAEWIEERMSYPQRELGPFEVQRRDGKTVLVNEQTVAENRIVTVISDITEIKRAQAQAMHASKLATLGEMSTAIAHELNQPLSVIRMAAGNCRLRLKSGPVDFPYLEEKLVRIEDQTARASQIIDHLRTYSRKPDRQVSEVAPHAVVERALSLVREQLRLSSIEVTTDLSAPSAAILGNTIQFEQVILNLLLNAQDALREHSSYEQRAEIKISVYEENGEVVFIVEDSGPGIAPSILPNIFEPFFTTKKVGSGTGLGLSISFGIIREAGGSISGENTGSGAKFQISLPAVKNTDDRN